VTQAMTTFAPVSFGAATTVGSSSAAQYVARQVGEGLQRLRDTNSLGAGVDVATQELHTVAEECGSPDWDSYGATAVGRETLRQAFRFLAALPLGMPAPSVGAEPDGHITFEWYHSPKHTLSVSIGSEGELHYAALLGLRKTFGSEPFFGEVPQTILGLVHRVVSA